MIFDNKPSIIGHRGFGAGLHGGYRENTVASFLAAVGCGLSWIELDVHRSADGQLMVCHDPVDATGESIVTRTAGDLAAEGIATLTEVLAALPADVAVDVEVKSIIDDAVDPPPERTPALVADVLQQQRGTRRFFVSSFDPSAVVYLAGHREAIGEVPLGLIAGTCVPPRQSIPAAANLGLDAVCLHTDSLSVMPERVIETAHHAGLEVLAWCPSPAESVRLASAGVDAVCVNDIPGVQAALAAAVSCRG